LASEEQERQWTVLNIDVILLDLITPNNTWWGSHSMNFLHSPVIFSCLGLLALHTATYTLPVSSLFTGDTIPLGTKDPVHNWRLAFPFLQEKAQFPVSSALSWFQPAIRPATKPDLHFTHTLAFVFSDRDRD
jgi:hypothetical protein